MAEEERRDGSVICHVTCSALTDSGHHHPHPPRIFNLDLLKLDLKNVLHNTHLISVREGL